MHLFNPAAFWFAVTIPIIILMYLLKPRYREISVSSTYLWEQALKDIEANSPWQRLKKNLLLFLQLLAALLLVLALSRPYFPVLGDIDSHVIVVLDCSASMMATDVLPSRFEAARRQAGQMIDDLGGRDEMTLIGMGERPVVLASRSRDRVQLRQALARARVTTERAALEPVLTLIASLVRDTGKASVIILSDGHTLPVENEVRLACPVELHRIGKKSDNVAITTLATRREGARVVTLARVDNFANETVETGIELLADGHLLDVRPLRLGPREVKDVFWEDLPRQTVTIEARLTRPDILSLDNRAWAVVDRVEPRQALLVSSGNVFMERAMALVPGLQLFKTTPGNYDQEMKGYSLYIFDGWLPAQLPPGNILCLNPPRENILVPVLGMINGIERVSPAGEDPLLKYVDVDGWQLARAGKLACPAWGHPLLEYKGVPLVLVGEHGNRRVAVFGFDLHDTNIPLQTGFPILVNNLGAWLLPGVEEGMVLTGNGESVGLRSLPGTEEICLARPGQEEEKIRPPFPRTISLQEPGVYRITQVTGSRRIVSYLVRNAGNALESNVKPHKLPWKGMVGGRGGEAGRKTNQELWMWLAWGALLILLVEWGVYRRGY